jgi:hypothetical protein
VAFSDVEVRDGLYAGISIETQVRCTINFGGEPFKHPPSATPASPASMDLESPTSTSSSSSSSSSSSPLLPSASFLAEWRPLQYDTVFGITSPFKHVLTTGTFLCDGVAVWLTLANELHARLGFTALHEASFLGLLDVARLLLEEGNADVHAKDVCQRTALHLAAIKYVLSTIQESVLLQPAGRLLMYVPLSRGDCEMLKVLFSAGASLQATDECGRTALHLAAMHGHLAAVKYLVAVRSPSWSCCANA